MGKRGPAPKPTVLKLQPLTGLQSWQINRHEPVPYERPVEPPPTLSEDARQVWDHYAPDMIAQRLLTTRDLDMFCAICEAIPINRRAWDYLATCDIGVVSPERTRAWQIARESSQLLLSLCGRFGLTPSDRAGLSVESPSEHGGPGRLLTG